jgi:hypothetical protein
MLYCYNVEVFKHLQLLKPLQLFQRLNPNKKIIFKDGYSLLIIKKLYLQSFNSTYGP